MAFPDELNAWVARELMRRHSFHRFLRLLHVHSNEPLPPLRPGVAVPGEIRASARPGPAIIAAPVPGLDWLCWPSADEAPVGWGEPYGPNPPLGTIQSVFSDTARIARELDATDIVVHGVNKIAAPRDWRSGDLRVSWNEDAVFSNGVQWISGSEIICAGVQRGTIDYLLWADISAERIYRRQCTIVDDVIIDVFGPEEYCVHNFSSGYWCEFSQDGTLMSINFGGPLVSNRAYEFVLPAAFTGQTIGNTRVAESEDAMISWTSNAEYSGERRYLVKSQYIDNVLRHAWFRIQISRLDQTTVLDYVSTELDLGVEPFPTLYQATACAGGQPFQLEYGGNAEYGYNRQLEESFFFVDIQLELHGQTVSFPRLVDDSFSLDRWCKTTSPTSLNCGVGPGAITDSPYAVGDELPWPGPPGYSPWPSALEEISPGVEGCAPVPYVTLSEEQRDTVHYRRFTQEFIDMRQSDRVGAFLFGTSDDGGVSIITMLDFLVYRNGVLAATVSRPGDYGTTDPVRRTDIITEADLETALDDTALDLFKEKARNIVAAGQLLDVSNTRSVLYLRAFNIDAGNFTIVNWLEGADIEGLLSIDGKPGAKIVIENRDRWFGVL